jgi:integrase
VSAALRKFYSMNDVLLNWNKIHAYLGEDEKTIEDEAYTHEEIKKMLQFAQLRTRVLILLLASSGIRMGALVGLKWKHLTYLEKQDIYQITIYPKSKQRYITFCTPECLLAINNYLDYRRKCGEEIGDETPLLRMDFAPTDQNVKVATVDALKMSLIKTTKNAGVRMEHEEVNGEEPR